MDLLALRESVFQTSSTIAVPSSVQLVSAAETDFASETLFQSIHVQSLSVCQDQSAKMENALDRSFSIHVPWLDVQLDTTALMETVFLQSLTAQQSDALQDTYVSMGNAFRTQLDARLKKLNALSQEQTNKPVLSFTTSEPQIHFSAESPLMAK